MTDASTDARYMQLAVRMAERGLGTTAPNPSVGAVLVRFDLDAAGGVVARGWTQAGGRPHAETEALRAAGPAARGATLYVTLEPCSHHGRTGPCAEALIAAGIARAVVGIEDPDARVSGRGLAMLRAAGVEVATGIEAAACRRVTLGHILRLTTHRPAVLMKMALMDDLTVPTSSGGKPRFVTGPEARAAGHLLRAEADAILVGRQTVTDDDPELTCRLPGMQHRSPIRIVLDRHLDGVEGLTPRTKLARTARDVPVWVITGSQAPSDNRAALEAMGVRVFVHDVISRRMRLDGIVETLAGEGITRLMVEGGRQTWEAFASAGYLDEAWIFMQPVDHPAWKLAPVPDTFHGFARFGDSLSMVERERGWIGADRYVRFQRADVVGAHPSWV